MVGKNGMGVLKKSWHWWRVGDTGVREEREVSMDIRGKEVAHSLWH